MPHSHLLLPNLFNNYRSTIKVDSTYLDKQYKPGQILQTLNELITADGLYRCRP